MIAKIPWLQSALNFCTTWILNIRPVIQSAEPNEWSFNELTRMLKETAEA